MRLNDRRYSFLGCLPTANGDAVAAPRPLVVALHGGFYTSIYFDVPGRSLVETARCVDVPLVALDRPGYGETSIEDPSALTHDRSAAMIDEAIEHLWGEVGNQVVGVVLVGHSIGASIALRVAARAKQWPLLGVAVSGIGLRVPDRGAAAPPSPPSPMISIASAVKDKMMFGREGSFSPGVRHASQAADAPAPVVELGDINFGWPAAAERILAEVTVPVHYRQGADDALWVTSEDEVRRFANACSSAPTVDAKIVPDTGHCIDLHHAGMSLHLDQLAFALRCALTRSI